MKKQFEKDAIRIFAVAGSFAEDKDAARKIRMQNILPSIERGEPVILDFSKVAVATQSFIHALVSEVLRLHGEKALELLVFRSCNATVKSVIRTVVDYSLAQREAQASS